MGIVQAVLLIVFFLAAWYLDPTRYVRLPKPKPTVYDGAREFRIQIVGPPDAHGNVPIIDRHGERTTISKEILLDAPAAAAFARRLRG